MVEIFPSLVLIGFGLFFLYTGIVSFKQPGSFANSLSLHAEGFSGRVEIRAQYGGFFLASALSQFAPFFGLLSCTSALVVALIIFGGLFCGRIAALFTAARGEALTPMIKALYVIDGLGFAAAVACLILAS